MCGTSNVLLTFYACLQSLTKVLSLIHFVETTANNLILINQLVSEMAHMKAKTLPNDV